MSPSTASTLLSSLSFLTLYIISQPLPSLLYCLISLVSYNDCNLGHITPLLKPCRGPHLSQTKTQNSHCEKTFFPSFLPVFTSFTCLQGLAQLHKCVPSQDLCSISSTCIVLPTISMVHSDTFRFLVEEDFLDL